MLKLYRHYLSIQLKGMMQYKASFFLTVIGQFLTSFGLFLTIYFVFARFQEVEGFTFSEVLLTFSVMLMSFTLAEMLVRGFDTFGSMISYGAFDRIMVRPRNEIFQVLASKIELTRCGRVLQAIVTLVYAIRGRNSGIFGAVHHLCITLFFYDRGAGIHECIHRRCKGAWEIPA